MEFEFLKSLVIIFGISAIIVFFLGKIRVPSIIGFLIAGSVLGPYGLELIEDLHIVKVFAEIGVVLLLFTIGLEFSLKNILTLRKTIFAGGFLQVLITSLIVFFLSKMTGQTMETSVILGMLTALSSTAIVLKLLFDRAEIDSPHGRISIGILIFQDLCVVIFILLIPMLEGTSGGLTEIPLVLAKSFAFIVSVIIAARWIVPKVLHHIVHTRVRELFVISIIFICLGTAFLTFKLGLSLALGAFIAGLVVSESEYAYQAISDIVPFKDSFNGLFFISVGMLMDINFFTANIVNVLLTVALIILLKTFSTIIANLITGNNLRISLHSSLILSQIGEFSFVISVAALKAGLISENIYQLFLSSAIITMVLTPVFVSGSPRISAWVTSRKVLERLQARKSLEAFTGVKDTKTDHVVIIGFGLNGKNLAIVLKELKVPYVILEMNNQTVLQMRKKGEPIYYGDGTSHEILLKLGIERARTVVISITDPSATRKIVAVTRKMNPHVYIVVRTRYLAEVQDLLMTGADEVIPSEFETSIEIFSRVLNFYHMPKSLINRYADKFRKDHYKLFVKGEAPRRLFQETLALMPDADYESHVIEEGSPAIDSVTLSEIQDKTGVHVIGVRRGDRTMQGLKPDFIFQKGDIVFLVGDKSTLDKAGTLYFRKKKSKYV